LSWRLTYLEGQELLGEGARGVGALELGDEALEHLDILVVLKEPRLGGGGAEHHEQNNQRDETHPLTPVQGGMRTKELVGTVREIRSGDVGEG
jgi:hypothetical protein